MPASSCGRIARYAGRQACRAPLTEDEVAAAAIAMLGMPGLCGADIDLSAGMITRS